MTRGNLYSQKEVSVSQHYIENYVTTKYSVLREDQNTKSKIRIMEAPIVFWIYHKKWFRDYEERTEVIL
jgi:hypothetical protein